MKERSLRRDLEGRAAQDDREEYKDYFSVASHSSLMGLMKFMRKGRPRFSAQGFFRTGENPGGVRLARGRKVSPVAPRDAGR